MKEEIENMEHIPNVLHAEAFITARFKEISALNELIGKNNRVTSIFQRLPKHMRRRAMSHTIKRVPRNLRDAHKRQLEKNRALKKPKKVRKRFRKRSKCLLPNYNRRQKTNLWLETHIWHAKRFRMVSKWGYKIAESSYEKTFRASYRGMKSHCVIQDISYHGCIELSGSLKNLDNGFKSMTSPECGVGICAKCWLNGCREGNVTLYHANSFPYNVIGNVTFMWKPCNESEFDRTLWLWCHPAFYQEVVDEFVTVFDLQLVTHEEEMKDPDEANTQKTNKMSNVEQMKIALKNVPSSRIPRYANKNKNIRVSLLKGTLNRFRLTGPLSNSVLTKALHPVELLDKIRPQFTTVDYWRKNEGNTPDAFELLEEYSFPSQFCPHVILGAHIVDPRLYLKRKRTKAVPANEINKYCLSLPITVAESFIWDAEIRDRVSLNKIASSKVNALRSDLLVPGFDEQLLSIVNTVIPILLVQRPGVTSFDSKLAFGSGWDIIIPANWGMPVWLSLILCGAKPGGLREAKTLNFESQKVPELFPDSFAGLTYYSDVKKDNENHFFRKPPNKRNNYIKNGFPTPFHCPWDIITREWSISSPSSSYFVYRNTRELRRLREYFENIKKRNNVSSVNFSPVTGSLIPVAVRMLDRGQLTPFSHICMPTESDLRLRLQNKMYGGPNEKIHKDVFHLKRKKLRMMHKKELKRLRRRRIKEKKSRIEKCIPLKLTKRKKSPTEAVVEAYLSATRELWIPSVVSKIRNHCDREICGFVVNSGFSFIQSCVSGQGYITSEAFSVLIDSQQHLKKDLMVLTRSPKTMSYRFCLLKVII